jgi:hypothetical protein
MIAAAVTYSVLQVVLLLLHSLAPERQFCIRLLPLLGGELGRLMLVEVVPFAADSESTKAAEFDTRDEMMTNVRKA